MCALVLVGVDPTSLDATNSTRTRESAPCALELRDSPIIAADPYMYSIGKCCNNEHTYPDTSDENRRS